MTYFLIVVAMSFSGFVFFAETLNPWPTGRYDHRKYGTHPHKRKLGFWCAMVVATTSLIVSFVMPASGLQTKLTVVLLFAVPCSLLAVVTWQDMDKLS